MSAVAAPSVEMNVTPSAIAEIKGFLAGEEDLPETAGLRVRVVPGGCRWRCRTAAASTRPAADC